MLYKRIFTIILAVVFSAVIFNGCGSDDDGNFFRYDIPAEPLNLDPQLASDTSSLLIIQNTFEGLMTHDKDGTLICGAAVSYTVSDDKLTYSFTLDENAKWVSRGDEIDSVTSHDFVFAFQRIFDKYTNSPYIKEFMCIKNAEQIVEGSMPKEALGVYATSATQLTVELASPSDAFLELTASTAAMPCNQNFFTNTKGKYGLNLENLAYNGPFTLSSWKAGKYLTLIHNKHFHNTKDVLPDKVTLYAGFTKEESLTRFLAGTTDVLSVSGDRIESLVSQGYGYEQFQDINWSLVFNTNDPVFSNRNIRLALASSFTGASYQNQFPIWLKPAKAFVPPVVTYGSQPYRQYAGLDFLLPYLPENANQHLVDGLAELELYELPKVTVLCPDTEPFSFLLQYVQQTWQTDLSAFVNLTIMPMADIQAAVLAGKYQMALMPFKPDSDNPDEALSIFTSDSPKNSIKYSDYSYDSLINSFSTSSSVDTGIDYLTQAEHKLIDDAVLIPFAYQTSFFAVSKTAKDIAVSPFGGGLYFKYAQKLKK